MAGCGTFEHSYARLPARFHAPHRLSPVAAPRLVALNEPLAVALGLDPAALRGDGCVQMLAGNRAPDEAGAIAMAYAGHQFGHFVPRLGDGRACLLGELTGPDGVPYDVQLKGSGPTMFSRRGDGRAALGPVLREYILSEAMWALGIPTTRALAAVLTGETVQRESAVPGAVFTRVARSHIRVGTFAYFAAQGDTDAVRILADHAIGVLYPALAVQQQRYRLLLEAVVARQAALVARWLLVGFIHGVMNTDNMAISGETIDYGPCAFLDGYDPGAVFSAIDEAGRYAYGNQPRIAHWNLTRLAEALLPLLAEAEAEATRQAQAALAGFAPAFQSAYLGGLRAKIGLTGADGEDDALVQALLQAMAENEADFTLTFRTLTDAAAGAPGEDGVRALFAAPAFIEDWLPRWRRRLALQDEAPATVRARMQGLNPAYIARNHLVEEAIVAGVERADFAPFATLLEVLAQPFEAQEGRERYAAPPLPSQRVLQTFCGT